MEPLNEGHLEAGPLSFINLEVVPNKFCVQERDSGFLHLVEIQFYISSVLDMPVSVPCFLCI